MFFVTKPRTYIAFCMLRALYWRYHVLRPSSIPSYPIASHHINPQEIHPITFHHVTHQVTWHDATVHHLTRHHFTWRWRHFTWRHMTWHDISQPITVLHLTSRRNQPQLLHLTSQPTDIILHHITAHHITTTDAPRKRNQPSPKHHHQAEMAETWRAQKLGFGAAHWLVALRKVFFPPKFPPLARPGTMGIITIDKTTLSRGSSGPWNCFAGDSAVARSGSHNTSCDAASRCTTDSHDTSCYAGKPLHNKPWCKAIIPPVRTRTAPQWFSPDLLGVRPIWLFRW